MIIECLKCNKKFEINSSLIPKKGRLLKCGSCDYEWFFKEQTNEKIILESDQINIESSTKTASLKNEEIEISPNTIEKEELEIKISPNTIEKEELEVKKNSLSNDTVLNRPKKKKISFFNFLIVFTVSIVSLILIIDSFKGPISIIFPNIEFILYNLYETLKDIKLFFKDFF